MNITPINFNNKNTIKPTFSGQIIPNKYLENCIQYTIKSNDMFAKQDLIKSLSALLNDGTERSFEFDAIIKLSSKGLKYAPTVKIDQVKQPLKLLPTYNIEDLNKKTLAEECKNSIDAVIKKCEILILKNFEKPTQDLKNTSTNNPNKDLKNELEKIYDLIFKKNEKQTI